MSIEALIFDVDGTLADTEELHRQAFNDTFEVCGLDWHWDPGLYRQLLKTTGGKERIAAFVGAHRAGEAAKVMPLVRELHALKTERYAALMRKGELSLRPGIKRLIEEARESSVRLAIATTTSLVNVHALLDATLGSEAARLFSVIAAGDEVNRKKPAPDVYRLVLDRMGVVAAACLAFEDSHNGLLAARAAGLQTVVTPSVYSMGDDFRHAVAVLSDLGELTAPYKWLAGEGSSEGIVTLEALKRWLSFRLVGATREATTAPSLDVAS